MEWCHATGTPRIAKGCFASPGKIYLLNMTGKDKGTKLHQFWTTTQLIQIQTYSTLNQFLYLKALHF